MQHVSPFLWNYAVDSIVFGSAYSRKKVLIKLPETERRLSETGACAKPMTKDAFTKKVKVVTACAIVASSAGEIATSDVAAMN